MLPKWANILEHCCELYKPFGNVSVNQSHILTLKVCMKQTGDKTSAHVVLVYMISWAQV